MKNALYCLCINASLSLCLVFFIGANGIAIATTVAAIFATISLFLKLLKEKVFVFSDKLQIKLLKTIYISILMMIAIYSFDSLFNNFNIIPLIRLILLSCIGGGLFFVLSFLLKVISIEEIKEFLGKK